MKLTEYARRLRYHDWWCGMSDDARVAKGGQANFRELAAAASESEAHGRLFDLARGWHARSGNPDRFESAWRWVGAYLWVHSRKLDEEACKRLVLVGDSDSIQIDWGAVERLLQEGS